MADLNFMTSLCKHGNPLGLAGCIECNTEKWATQTQSQGQQLSEESRQAVIRTMIPEKEWTAAQHIEAAEHHMLEARKILSRIR